MSPITSLATQISDLITSWAERFSHSTAQLRDFPAGQEIVRASPEEQRAFVMAAVAWLEDPVNVPGVSWTLAESVSALLRRSLPFTHDDVLSLLGWVRSSTHGWRIEPHVSRIVTTYLASNPRTSALDKALDALVADLEGRAWGADQRRRLLKLKELAGIIEMDQPLLAGEPWADAARAEIAALPPEQRAPWTLLLQQCAAAGGSTPSKRWLKAATALVERLGVATVRGALLRWLPLAEQPRTEPLVQPWGAERDPLVMQERNLDILRGLVWLCATDDTRELARALGALAVAFYRKLPGVGPRSARLANAAIWALGQMPGQHSMAQLALLKTRVRMPAAQKQIEAALANAAERAGLLPDELAELLVPTYGLEEVGLRREMLGGVIVELVVAGGVELRHARRRQAARRGAEGAQSRARRRPEGAEQHGRRHQGDAPGPARPHRAALPAAADLAPRRVARALPRPPAGRHARPAPDLALHGRGDTAGRHLARGAGCRRRRAAACWPGRYDHR